MSMNASQQGNFEKKILNFLKTFQIEMRRWYLPKWNIHMGTQSPANRFNCKIVNPSIPLWAYYNSSSIHSIKLLHLNIQAFKDPVHAIRFTILVVVPANYSQLFYILIFFCEASLFTVNVKDGYQWGPWYLHMKSPMAHAHGTCMWRVPWLMLQHHPWTKELQQLGSFLLLSNALRQNQPKRVVCGRSLFCKKIKNIMKFCYITTLIKYQILHYFHQP